MRLAFFVSTVALFSPSLALAQYQPPQLGSVTFAGPQPVTTAAGAEADIGTGASPAANTVNANLGKINSTLGSPLQTGGTVVTGSGSVTTEANSAQNLTANQATNTALGAPGATAATGDAGSFNLNALFQRNNVDLTAIKTALNSPFQAGGSIGNTSFGATGSATSLLGQGTSGTAANSATTQGLGTAGTPAGGVNTIQGVSGGQPVPTTIGAGSAQVGYTLSYSGYAEASAATLGASSTNVSTYRAIPNTGVNYFGCRAVATQAYNLNIMETLAGGTAVQVATTNPTGSSPVAANVASDLSVRVRGAADTYACQVVNTTATAGTDTVASSFTAN